MARTVLLYEEKKNMGLSREQSQIVLNEFLKRESEKLSPAERMVFSWCKILIAESERSYWQGVSDGMVLAEGLVALGKSLQELVKKQLHAAKDYEPSEIYD